MKKEIKTTIPISKEVKQKELHWKNLREYINQNKKNIHLTKIIPKTQKSIGFRDFLLDFELDEERNLVGISCLDCLYFQKEKFWVSLKDFMNIDFNQIPEDVKSLKNYILKNFKSKF